QRAATLSLRTRGEKRTSARQLLFQAPGENPHLLLRLLVAPFGRDFDAGAVRGQRIAVAAGRGERLAVELPRGGEVGVERNGSRQMLGGPRRVPGLQVLVAEREPEQCAVLARSEHLLEILECGRRRHLT